MKRPSRMYKTMIANGRRILVAGIFAGLLGQTLAAQNTSAPQQVPADIVRELDAMKKRIEQLEAELKSKKAQEEPGKATAEEPVKASAVAPPPSEVKPEVKTAEPAPVMLANYPAPAEAKTTTDAPPPSLLRRLGFATRASILGTTPSVTPTP